MTIKLNFDRLKRQIAHWKRIFQDCYYEKEIRKFHKRNVRFQLSNTGKEHRNKLQKRFRMKIKASNKEFSLLLRNCRLDHSRGNCLNLAISENVYVSVKKQQQVEWQEAKSTVPSNAEKQPHHGQQTARLDGFREPLTKTALRQEIPNSISDFTRVLISDDKWLSLGLRNV